MREENVEEEQEEERVEKTAKESSLREVGKNLIKSHTFTCKGSNCMDEPTENKAILFCVLPINPLRLLKVFIKQINPFRIIHKIFRKKVLVCGDSVTEFHTLLVIMVEWRGWSDRGNRVNSR
jgi:hypothetical protein